MRMDWAPWDLRLLLYLVPSQGSCCRGWMLDFLEMDAMQGCILTRGKEVILEGGWMDGDSAPAPETWQGNGILLVNVAAGALELRQPGCLQTSSQGVF